MPQTPNGKDICKDLTISLDTAKQNGGSTFTAWGITAGTAQEESQQSRERALSGSRNVGAKAPRTWSTAATGTQAQSGAFRR